MRFVPQFCQKLNSVTASGRIFKKTSVQIVHDEGRYERLLPLIQNHAIGVSGSCP